MTFFCVRLPQAARYCTQLALFQSSSEARLSGKILLQSWILPRGGASAEMFEQRGMEPRTTSL